MAIQHWIMLAMVVWGCVFGGFGAYIASQKGRAEGEGMAFGFFLGPIGLLIIAILPDVAKSGETPEKPAEAVYQFRPRKMLGEIREDRSIRQQ
jgi:hypothetical protein